MIEAPAPTDDVEESKGLPQADAYAADEGDADLDAEDYSCDLLVDEHALKFSVGNP